MAAGAVEDPSGADIESAIGTFNESRPRLFGIAYRMLGSVAEAEDIVQEAWLRWQQTDRSNVRNPAGFLTTVTTRLALNTAASARVRREQYVGSWLPEPVDTSADPSLGAEKAEALEAAVLVLLEKLAPEQRAAYVLREAFGYSLRRDRGDPGHDARERPTAGQPREEACAVRPQGTGRPRRAPGAARGLRRRRPRRRREAAGAGAVRRRRQHLRRRGHRTAGSAPPVAGRDDVARFIAGWSDWWTDTTLTWVETNGQASVLVTRGDAALVLLSISTSKSGIDQLLWVMAPDKLTHVAR